MGRLLIRLVVNALALWITVMVLTPNVEVDPYGEAGAGWNLETVITYLLLAVTFGVVNGVVGGLVRVVAFPLYILTLGLISLVVNGLLFVLVAWLSTLVGFGLSVANFGWGVLGALLLGVISWLMGILVRPFTRKES